MEIGNPPVAEARRLAARTLRSISAVAEVERRLPASSQYYPLNYVWRDEPRVPLLLRLLRSVRTGASAAAMPGLEELGGVRLRDLHQWLVTGDSADPGRVMSAVSWSCGMACEFCYQKGTPREMKPRRLSTSPEEMATRIRYYDPGRGARLFDKTNFDTDEMLNHPEALRFMRDLRAKTREPFYDITTNGKPLTEAVVTELKQLGPLEIGVSLDSVDAQLRKVVLGDPHPHRAPDGVRQLERHGIPFAVSVVAWPALGLDDMEQTIRFAADHSASYVRVCLPGFSRYFPTPPSEPMEGFWEAVVRRVRRLRQALDMPVVVLPSLYEELLAEEPATAPWLQGVIRHSPAARAGLKRGDKLVSIGGIPLRGRPQAAHILKSAQAEGVWRIELEVARNGATSKEILFETGHARTYRYPYLKEYLPVLRNPYGMMLGDGPDPWLGEQIHAIAERRGAVNVAVLTSWLLERSVRLQLEEVPADARRCTPELFVPANRYFGGSVRMGDLLTNADFVSYIREELAPRSSPPDLVLIPATPFTSWARDLLGRCNREIQRSSPIPVEFVPARRIWT
jgi:hypothetical protein